MSRTPLAQELEQQPSALRTTVKVTGVISFSDADSALLDATNRTIADALMQLTVLANDTAAPPAAAAAQLAALRAPVLGALDTLVALAAAETGAIAVPAVAAAAAALYSDVCAHKARVAECFASVSDDSSGNSSGSGSSNSGSAAATGGGEGGVPAAVRVAREASSGVLTVLEKCMALFGARDCATLAAIDDACAAAAESVRALQTDFVATAGTAGGAAAADAARSARLVDAAQLFVLRVTACVRALAARLDVVADADARAALERALGAVQTLTPRLLAAAQGDCSASDGDSAAAGLLEALARARECARCVPPCAARVAAEYVGGDALAARSSALAAAVAGRAPAAVADAARAYALEVAGVAQQCRRLGVGAAECDVVRAALADVLRLARTAALTGAPADAARFRAALECLNALVAALPQKVALARCDESTAIFDAARELSTGALPDLVRAMKQ